MSAIDLPPGIGLVGSALGEFRAPRRARVLAGVALAACLAAGFATWTLVSRRPFGPHTASQVVAPIALTACALLGFLVRSARLAITRDGVRWGWRTLSFTQQASRIVRAHVWNDGVTLEARRGSWWFLSARDWDRYDALVRQLKRAALPVEEHAATAPLRARMQSYGRFLDALVVAAAVAAFGVLLWAA
jgi:hypothetical protein